MPCISCILNKPVVAQHRSLDPPAIGQQADRSEYESMNESINQSKQKPSDGTFYIRTLVAIHYLVIMLQDDRNILVKAISLVENSSSIQTLKK